MSTGALSFLSLNNGLWKIMFYRIYIFNSLMESGSKSRDLATSAFAVSRLICGYSTAAFGVSELAEKHRNKGLTNLGKQYSHPIWEGNTHIP